MSEGVEPDGMDRAPLLDPAAALLPGRRDAARLAALWVVRRSFTWVLFLGLACGIVVAQLQHEAAELEIDTSSPDAVLNGVLTRYGFVFLALVIRIGANWVALAFALPLARAQRRDAVPPRSLRARVDRGFEHLNVARAFSALRWTQIVREEAINRLAPNGRRWETIDRAVGLANVVAVAACVVVVVLFGATVEY